MAQSAEPLTLGIEPCVGLHALQSLLLSLCLFPCSCMLSLKQIHLLKKKEKECKMVEMVVIAVDNSIPQNILAAVHRIIT